MSRYLLSLIYVEPITRREDPPAVGVRVTAGGPGL